MLGLGYYSVDRESILINDESGRRSPENLNVPFSFCPVHPLRTTRLCSLLDHRNKMLRPHCVGQVTVRSSILKRPLSSSSSTVGTDGDDTKAHKRVWFERVDSEEERQRSERGTTLRAKRKVSSSGCGSQNLV